MKDQPGFGGLLAGSEAGPSARRFSAERYCELREMKADARVGRALRGAGVRLDPKAGDLAGQLQEAWKKLRALENGKFGGLPSRGGKPRGRPRAVSPMAFYWIVKRVEELQAESKAKSRAEACRMVVKELWVNDLGLPGYRRKKEIERRGKRLEVQIAHNARRARDGNCIARLFKR